MAGSLISRRFSVFFVVLVCCIFIASTAVAASPRKSTRPSRKSAPARSSRRYDEYDEDEDEDYDTGYDDYDDESDYDNYRPQPKRSPRKPARGGRPPPRSSGALTRSPRGRGRGPAGPPRPRMGAAVLEKMKEKAATASDEASSKYKELARIAKGVVSSNYERFVLQITWPDDKPVAEEDVRELLETFYDVPRAKPYDPKADVYRATLRKLWARQAEADWRTCVKATYVLQRIARNARPRDARKFALKLKAMAKEMNPKSPEGYTYFNMRQLLELSPAGQGYREFLGAYALFTFNRVTLFAGSFEDLAGIHKPPATEAQAVAQLRSAELVLRKALACRLGAREQNAVTEQALGAVLRDVRDLWKAIAGCVDKLAAGEYSTEGKGAKAPAKELRDALECYSEISPEVEKFAAATGAQLKLRRPRPLAAADAGALRKRLAALGGAAATAAAEAAEVCEEEEGTGGEASSSGSGGADEEAYDDEEGEGADSGEEEDGYSDEDEYDDEEDYYDEEEDEDY